MKTNKLGSYKKLALGIALATGVTGANAGVINPGSMGINDVFLSVWDETKQTSFTADLGVDLTTFVGLAGANKAYDLGSAFTTWASTTLTTGVQDTLTYNVSGVNQVTPATNTTVNGVMLSGESTMLPWPTTAPNYNTMAKNQGIVNQHVNDINVDGLGAVGNTDTSYFNTMFWGAGQGSAVGYNSSTVGGLGITGLPSINNLLLEYAHTNGETSLKNSTLMTLQILPGSFSLDLANSSLNWTTTAVTAVPVPAAVWLFMGGLMSVLGFQKRKSALAA